jgi:hypothetical protein
MAGDATAARQCYLQSAAIARDPTTASPWQWISSTGTTGDCRKTEYCQRGGRQLYPGNTCPGGCVDRGFGYPTCRQRIPATQSLPEDSSPIQRRRVVCSKLRGSVSSPSHPDSAAATASHSAAAAVAKFGRDAPALRMSGKFKSDANRPMKIREHYSIGRRCMAARVSVIRLGATTVS